MQSFSNSFSLASSSCFMLVSDVLRKNSATYIAALYLSVYICIHKFHKLQWQMLTPGNAPCNDY